jgi:phosphate transport system substrate-binding protein
MPRLWFLVLIAAAAAVLFAPGPEGAVVRVAGSTALMPLAERAAQAVPGARFAFYATGTFAGVELVRRGLADVALADLPVPGAPGRAVPLGAEDVPVVAGCPPPVADVTVRELAQVLAGRITDWRALGGPPGPVRPLFRTATSGLGQGLRRRLLGDRPLGADVVRLSSNGEVLRLAARLPGAVGFADPGPARGVCLLAVDGRRPGQPGYPLRLDAYAYATRWSPAARALVRALRSRIGR